MSEAVTATAGAAARSAGHWRATVRTIGRNPLLYVALGLFVVDVGMAVAPALFARTGPSDCDLSLSLVGPSSANWLGRDLQGCDVWSRSVYGARASIAVGLAVTAVTSLLGGMVGAVAGYFGGWIDAVLSRITEIFLAIPLLLGASVLLTIFRSGGSGLLTVVLALSVHGWAQVSRIMRSAVIETKQKDYVLAARAIGSSPVRTLVRHVVPNSLAPWLVVATTNLGVFITYEAIISMLGVGLQPPTISWGQMINDAQPRFLDSPLPLLSPAIFLSVTVLAVILLGDIIRDAGDPKLRGS